MSSVRPVWELGIIITMETMSAAVKGITTKKTQDEFGALVTNIIAGHKSVAAYDINSFFPLFIYDQGKAKPNLNPNFMLSLSDHLCKSRKIVLDNMNQFARDIFCYIYVFSRESDSTIANVH